MKPWFIIILIIIGTVFTIDKWRRAGIKKAIRYAIGTIILSVAANFIYDSISTQNTVNIKEDEIQIEAQIVDLNNVTYEEVLNEKCFYSIKVPDFLKPDKYNGDIDQRYYNGNVELLIKAREYVTGIPHDFTREYMLESFDGTVLLDFNQFEKDDWYVLSIKTDKRWHYRKCMLNEDEKIVRMFTFSCPANEQDNYSGVVDIIEDSFKPLH